MIINRILDNNKKWVDDNIAIDKNYFKNLSKGQKPEVLYLGCSDSRVAAETFMGFQPGEVFVHRNIANVISNNDMSSMSVINYALNHLKVKHIIVCGHYHCGGINAAMKSADLGILNSWLRNIRDVYRLHKNELDKINDSELKNKRLVELNVQEQCINVIKTSEVQKAYKDREIYIHGWVFDIGSGKIINLNIDFNNILNKIMEVYRII